MNGWDLALIAGVIAGYAAVSRTLQPTPLTAPIVFVGCGFVLGTSGLDWIQLGEGSESVRLLAEVTLTLVLFTDAARIDMTALRREYTVPLRLLGIGLPLTILAGWALAVISFSGFAVAEALVLAVILAPTDAALGQSVVSDDGSLRDPSGAQRRVRAERRALRAAAVHRDRPGRHGGRCRIHADRDRVVSRRSDTACCSGSWPERSAACCCGT